MNNMIVKIFDENESDEYSYEIGKLQELGYTIISNGSVNNTDIDVRINGQLYSFYNNLIIVAKKN